LVAQLHARAKDIIQRITQTSTRIKEKELQIDLMTRENEHKSIQFKALRSKENEYLSAEQSRKDMTAKINRLKSISNQQNQAINEEIHLHTLNFEKQCRENINLVAMEMALKKPTFKDLEADRLREKVLILKSCINRKRGFLNYS
jgi:aspartate oxidase